MVCYFIRTLSWGDGKEEKQKDPDISRLRE